MKVELKIWSSFFYDVFYYFLKDFKCLIESIDSVSIKLNSYITSLLIVLQHKYDAGMSLK